MSTGRPNPRISTGGWLGSKRRRQAVGGSAVGLSLLESSGAANGTIAAAGHFCGEPAVVLLDATTGTLSVMHGPTPFLVARLHYSGGWGE